MAARPSGPWDLPPDWPVPPAEARALGEVLAARIGAAIDAGGGSLGFDAYMELALYSPGLGYYSAGLRKFGAGGDFITAPETSSLFSRCLARSCASVLETLGGGDLLELGAGSGVMAADLLAELARLDRLPDHYYILERSADLRGRQADTLAAADADLAARVVWLDTLPAPGLVGVVVGNEVLDALPVQRFRWRDGVLEEGRVARAGTGFGWHHRPADGALAAAVDGLGMGEAFSDGYESELNTGLAPWLGSIAERLAAGLLLFIDYGYPRAEYYHPQRTGGTLMCHYRHRAHPDPFLLPGLQDITAHVDFTAVAEAGAAAGLDVLGFCTQAHFLLDSGLDELLAAGDPGAGVAWLRQAQQAKTLVLPGEMGERFKCIGLGRGLDGPPRGFRAQDLRNRL